MADSINAAKLIMSNKLHKSLSTTTTGGGGKERDFALLRHNLILALLICP
ncbi:hypothetical protein [Lactococcus cremoris]|nr:hypothetical protein [Lactococcus cremoris]